MVQNFTAVFENPNDARCFANEARKIAEKQASLSANEIELKDRKVNIHFLVDVATAFMLPLVKACKKYHLDRYNF